MATGTDRTQTDAPGVVVQPARTGVARWVALAFVLVVPATVALLLALHPAGGGTRLLGLGYRYYWLHIVLLFGFPAVGVALAMLVRGLRTPESWMARGAAFVFACTYGAYDALAGITIGAYTMAAERADSAEAAEAIIAQRQPLTATGIVGDMARYGRWAWIVATVAAAIALYRAGVRWWVLFPLVLSGYLLLEHDHVPPYGWSAFWAMFIAALVIEIVPRRDPWRDAEQRAGARSVR